MSKIKKRNFLSYGKQWLDKNDIKAVVNVLKTDWLTQGPKVEEFEKRVAQYCGAKYAVAVSSGTAALELAYLVGGIGKGDEVITTPLTFTATCSALVHYGGRPVFVDIKEDSFSINPEEIEKKITKKTKAIVPVDFAGIPCDYDEISKIAKRNKLLIIEDASHALGSLYKGKKIGRLADMTVFSFHPVKGITTGEGGMVLTDNKKFYEKLKILRHHGIVKKPEKGGWYYDIETPGFNFRITDFQCALGLTQLKKLGKFIKRRREIVARYNKAFKDIEEIITPQEKSYVKSAWHIYPVQLKLERLKATRKKIFDYLREQGIGVQVHYIPLHLISFYKKRFGYRTGDFPIAENYYKRAITLPLFPKMTDSDVEKVVRVVKKAVLKFKK